MTLNLKNLLVVFINSELFAEILQKGCFCLKLIDLKSGMNVEKVIWKEFRFSIAPVKKANIVQVVSSKTLIVFQIMQNWDKSFEPDSVTNLLSTKENSDIAVEPGIQIDTASGSF